MEIIVNDKMQKNYTYELTEPTGKNFDPKFKPELTPKQILEFGVFGAKHMNDCKKEFSKNWLEKTKLNPNKQDPQLNYFKVNASQPLKVWKNKGQINEQDPRRWF